MTSENDPALSDTNDRAEALEALHRAGLLDTESEVRFDRITRLVRDVLGVPICLISLVDRDRQFFKSASGLPEPWATRRETPLSHSFCKHVVAQRRPVIVTNAASDGRVCGNLAFHEMEVVAYLGVPIRSEGHVIGALCAIDSRPRLWKTSELERLQDFAAIIDGEIEMRRLAAERDAARQEAELLAHEHSHRVKNSLSVAASLVAISGAEAGSVEELVRIARDRIQALAAAQKLGWSRDGASELRSLLDTILGPYTLHGGDMVRIKGKTLRLPKEAVTPLSLIFHELATNAAKYGGLSHPAGGIDLGWTTEDDRLAIRWSERVPETHGFAESSAPFTGENGGGTRNGNGVSGKEGFGSRLVGLCVRQLSGKIEIGDGPGGGREIALTLPWQQGAAPA